MDGDVYLAYQNLATNFVAAPAASVVVSKDHGRTWSADTDTPMFGDPGNRASPTASKFTTIFFLDFGKNSSNAIDGYVYAYGLDTNWRKQQALYLARVPHKSVLNAQAGSSTPACAAIALTGPATLPPKLRC